MNVVTQMEYFRVARHASSKRMPIDAVNYMLFLLSGLGCVHPLFDFD